MTFYILMQHVAYEGSSLKGSFASLQDTLDHIDQMDGYCMDGFRCDRFGLIPLDEWDIDRVQGATGGWHIPGPADLSFSIFACSLGGK